MELQHIEYNPEYIYIHETLEKHILENFPHCLSEWKIFIYQDLYNEDLYYNDKLISKDVFKDLLYMRQIKSDGIDYHQGELHKRFKFTHFKYPEKYKRNASFSLKQLILKRDGYRCRNCSSEENLSIDHIIPWSFGGRTEYDNLQILCRSCNSRKGNR